MCSPCGAERADPWVWVSTSLVIGPLQGRESGVPRRAGTHFPYPNHEILITLGSSTLFVDRFYLKHVVSVQY